MKSMILAVCAALGMFMPATVTPALTTEAEPEHSILSLSPELIAYSAKSVDFFAQYSIVMQDDVMCVAQTGNTGVDITHIDVDKLDGTNVMSINGCNYYTCTIDLTGLKGYYKVTATTNGSPAVFSDVVLVP